LVAGHELEIRVVTIMNLWLEGFMVCLQPMSLVLL
jgi:hypothetical protein